DGIRGRNVTGVQTCALPILPGHGAFESGQLLLQRPVLRPRASRRGLGRPARLLPRSRGRGAAASGLLARGRVPFQFGPTRKILRSEERRVGKGWRKRRRRTE